MDVKDFGLSGVEVGGVELGLEGLDAVWFVRERYMGSEGGRKTYPCSSWAWILRLALMPFSRWAFVIAQVALPAAAPPVTAEACPALQPWFAGMAKTGARRARKKKAFILVWWIKDWEIWERECGVFGGKRKGSHRARS